MNDEKCPQCGAEFCDQRLMLVEDYSEEQVITFACGTEAIVDGIVLTETMACVRRQLAESQRLLGEATARADKAEKAANDAEAHWRDEVIAARVARDKADEEVDRLRGELARMAEDQK